MTPKQAALLRAIKQYWDEHGYSPSISDLEKLTNSYSAAVRYQLNLLEKRGHITREFGAHRSIRVIAAA